MLSRIFLFKSWFVSRRSDYTMMDFGADLISLVKSITKRFCKDTIKNLKRVDQEALI